MRKLILAGLLSLPLLGICQGSTGEVVGVVVSKADNIPAYGAKVQTESNGSYYRGITDADGKFRISAIPPGKYSFTVIYGTDTLRDIAAVVPIEGIDNMGTLYVGSKVTDLGVVTATERIFPKLTYGVAPEIKMSREQIKTSPLKFNQKALIASMSSDIKLTEDGSLVFRGARKGDMIYVMDGVKMTDVANVPSASIGGMMAYTGGIPAKYGDTTGGVVVMESLGYFDLYREWMSKQD